MHSTRLPLPPPLLFDLLRFIRLVAHRSLTSLACLLLRTNTAHIYQISPRKVQRCLACHRHFCLPILGIFATVRPNCKRDTRTSSMLPPFEAILFDYDGTLALLNLDFAAMRRHLHAFTVAQGISPEELRDLDILEMLDWATGWLRQHSPEQADRYARDAEQLIQAMEVEAARSSGLLPGVPELLTILRQEQIGIGIVTRNCDAAVRVTFPHIDTYCQAFMPRNRVTQVKPHPAHLQAALDCLGTTPE